MLIRFIVMYIFIYAIAVVLVYQNLEYSGEISFLVLLAAISFLFAKVSILENLLKKNIHSKEEK